MNGRAIKITRLGDSGAGSLRAAIDESGDRLEPIVRDSRSDRRKGVRHCANYRVKATAGLLDT